MSARTGTGRLVLAATPLGNAADAARDLVTAFGSTDVVAAEDTRKLRALTSTLGITPPGRIVSFYDAVEQARMPGLLRSLRAGNDVLLVTDAGMPAVSDPGYRLVNACLAEGVPITCLPGPSAVSTALAVSGLPVERFSFEGFAPRKEGPRRRWFHPMIASTRTCVFFEAPHRLATTLDIAADLLGPERAAAVCRNLTKVDEEVRRGVLAELAGWARPGVRGEITVVVAPAG